MQINLDDALTKHLKRVEAMAEVAAEDEDESYSSRASAMTALTNLIEKIIKQQKDVVNMRRLQQVEQIIIKTTSKYLSDSQKQEFISELNKIDATTE